MDEKLFDLMTKMYAEMQEMKNSITNEMHEIKGTMATKEDIASVQRDVVRLENHILDKVNALFDARQMQIDHETAMAKDIKQVQGTVEKIELKIIRNS